MIKKRVLQIAEYKGVAKEKFFEKIGMTYANFKGKSKLTPLNSDAVANITTIYPDINPDWLLTGKGEMLRSSNPTINIDNRKPLLAFEAIAGKGAGIFNELTIDRYYDVYEFKDCEFYISVKGNSMYPKYSSGDILACKRIQEKLFFQWNKPHVLYTHSQGVIVKRICKSQEKGFIKCVSDNEKYESFDVPLSDVIDIAIVIGAIHIE